MAKISIDVARVNLRGLELRIPTLTGAHLEDHEPVLNTLLAPKPDQTMQDTLRALRKLVLVACQPTHPDLTDEQLRQHIDMRNRKSLVEALLGTAGGFEPAEVEVTGEGWRP